MGKSKIDWTDKVWNPITGCTKISSGCKNCYAERMSKRLAGRAGYPEEGFKVTLHPERLEEPLRWKKLSRIFVCSMGDLFHKDVPQSFISKVLDTAFHAYIDRGHIFLFLTKRPERMRYEITLWSVARGNHMNGLEGFWLGVSVEDQQTANERIPLLLQTPAAKRFVSYEPALGPVDFLATPAGDILCRCNGCTTMTSETRLDWIIMGGESGPGARPMHPDWARSVRDQCKAAGVAFWFKQWGEWIPQGQSECPTGIIYDGLKPIHKWGYLDTSARVGKARAGCLLDGKEHKEMPR